MQPDRAGHRRGTDSVAPPADAQVRSRMQAQRERDTGAEREIRSQLHRLGLRFRLHQRLLAGSRREVDIVFRRARVAVFVDGCFWHACPDHATWPQNNAGFWRQKIEENAARDRDTDERLRAEGWAVLRVWEHESPEEAARAIAEVIRARTT